MNLSRQFPSRDVHPNAAPSLRGIYRYRHKVDGKSVWYGLNDEGQIIRARGVQPHETEANVVAWIADAVYPGGIQPRLRLVVSNSSRAAVDRPAPAAASRQLRSLLVAGRVRPRP